MPRPLPPELAALSGRMRVLAARQGGVLTAAQCHRLGGDPAAVRRLVDTRRWMRARRGIYRDPHFVPPNPIDAAFHGRCAALLAALGGSAVVSHTAGARLLGLPRPPRDDPRVSVTRRPPAATNDPLSGDVYVRDYRDADVIDVAGVPVLAGARLVIDCCEAMPPDSALAVADAALFRRLTTVDALLRAAEQRRGRPGSRTADLVVERADPGGHNWFESMSRWWLLEGGLPVPRLQVPFLDERGEVGAKVDLWFPEHRTVGEADGAGKYDEPGALFAEKRREDWLRDTHRVEVVRWVPEEMRTREGRAAVVARFQRAFGRRS